MTDRIDHMAEAEDLAEVGLVSVEKKSLDHARATFAFAQVHATLALVAATEAQTEQVRIANLIALAHADTHEAMSLPALQALSDLHRPEGRGWVCTSLQPDIATALGLGDDDD